MLFSSLEFLYAFLPLCLLLSLLSPRRWQNLSLLLLSLLFYAYGEPVYVLLMVATITVNFSFGRLLCRKGRRRALLALAVGLNLSLLFFFKYAGMLIPTFWSIPLPIGISFYTFQAVSYLADVYRGEVAAARSLTDFGAYISMFPQLIAGPIVRYSDVSERLASRPYTAERIASGTVTFVAGLSKKVLLANGAGALADNLLARGSTVLCALLWLISFALQIYFDFSGYSDMAVGLGRILGFDFPENFRYPYTARSITDFWRRWHVTLSSFFREYVYIPLGGNRRGRARTYFNLLVVWALTGLWHGASLNFLLWGLYFFLLLCLEKAFLLKGLDRLPRPLGHLYALPLILFGWFIFASDGTRDTASALRLLLGNAPFLDGWVLYELKRNALLLSVLVLGATPLPRRLASRLSRRVPCLYTVLALLGLILCTAYLASSGYNPFLYFRF